MCGVIAGAITGGVLSIAGGIVGGVASIKQGNAQRDADNANADAAEAEARFRVQQSSKDAGDVAAKGAAIAATQTAANAGGGAHGGTTDAAQLESTINAQRDEATLKANAARDAWGLQRQAASYRAQGKAAHTAGVLGAAGSIIGGAAQAASGASSAMMATRAGGAS